MVPMPSNVASLSPSSLRTRLLRFVLALLFAMIAFFGGMQSIPPHAHADGGNVLYAPDLNSYPNASASSPRWIRLHHSGSANGTMLATFDNNNTFAHPYGDGVPASFAIYSSATQGVISVVSDAVHNYPFLQQPALLEVPQQLGSGNTSLPEGTLLLAGNFEAGNVADQDLEVYRSDDHGQSWSYLSSCATGGHSGAGTWEPYLQVDGYGNLVCYFSDERQNGSGYSQFIGHVVSTDGGHTWGSEVMDAGVNNGSTRPGMATVVRLSNGQYLMSFETPGLTNSEVHVKTSSDGDNWGNASDLGTRVQTSDGSYFGASPQMTVSSTGEVFLVSKAFFNSSNQLAAEDGNVILGNKSNSPDGWFKITAPFSVNHPVPSLNFDCNNYSPTLLASDDGTSILLAAPVQISDGHCEIVYGETGV